MLKLNSKIIIGDYSFDFVTEISIDSTWEHLTDKATITIPRSISFEGRPIVAGNNSLLKRGDKVEINIGYDGQYTKVFVGYISNIKPNLPLEIECEDKMWKLKQKIIKNKSWRQVDLKELIAYITEGTGVKYKLLGDVKLTESEGTISKSEKSKLYKNPELPQFRINNATAAQVLDYLRKDYNLHSFFRDEILYVGLAYYPPLRKDHVFKFQENIIEHNLIYKRDDDAKLKVKAISISPTNGRTTVEVGDPDGDLRTLHYYGLSETELKRIAEDEIERLKYEGYYGTFTTFAEPVVNHGDAVILIDNKLPEREGIYLVKKVKSTFGINGGRQVIELERKIA